MDFGTLHLPLSPTAAAPLAWADVTVNRILVVAALILAFSVLRDYLQLFPLLCGSVVRSRANIEIQHSVSQTRYRNRCALALLPVPALLMDRYGLYPAEFIANLPAEWRVAACYGVLAAYAVIRRLLHVMVPKRKLDSESRGAVHCALFNYYLAFLPLILLTAGLLWIFHAPDSVFRWTIWVELIACVWLALLREWQILASKYSPLLTFLYLCALEALPLACLIVPAVLL